MILEKPLPEGVLILRGYLSTDTQSQVLEALRGVLRASPLFTPQMKNGTPFRYKMSNCGDFGWMADRKGYRYEREDPRTGRPWPAMPEVIRSAAVAAAARVGEENYRAESCLINFYANPKETLGLHQDSTERDQKAPIVSFSLGDTGVFALGGMERGDKTQDILLQAGDCLVMHGPSRMRFHAFKKLIAHTGTLPKGGRINLTVRTVG